MKVEAPRLEEWIKPQGRQSGIVENGGPTQPFYKPCRRHHLYPFYLDERTWKSFVGFSIGDPFLSIEADLGWSEANPSGLTPLLVTLNTELWPVTVGVNPVMASEKWFSLDMKRDMWNHTPLLPLDAVLSLVMSEAVALIMWKKNHQNVHDSRVNSPKLPYSQIFIERE